MLDAIKNRCSVRKYKPEQIKDEELNTILEAARMAPSGKNDRKAKIYVFQNPEKMEELGRIFLEAALAGNAEGIPAAMASFMKRKTYHFCFHAPTFLLVTYEKENYNALANTACLLENAMLAATELSIGSCYLNMGRRCAKDEGLQNFLKQFGYTDEEEVTGGLALGYPDGEPTRNKKTAGNEIVWIR